MYLLLAHYGWISNILSAKTKIRHSELRIRSLNVTEIWAMWYNSVIKWDVKLFLYLLFDEDVATHGMK